MAKLAEHMTFYAAYHRDPRNRLTHFFGVPTIVFSYLLLLSYPQVDIAGFPVSAALVFTAVMTLYYMTLDAVIGFALGLVMVPLLYAAHLVAGMPLSVGVAAFLASFLGGWAVQLLGHKFEGNRPALVSNVWQMFVAPLFLMAEVFFMLGLKKDVEADVERRVEAFVAANGGAVGRPADAPARA